MLNPEEEARKAKLLQEIKDLEDGARARLWDETKKRRYRFADIKKPEDLATARRFQQVFGRHMPHLLEDEHATVVLYQWLLDGLFGNPIRTINKSTFDADLKRFKGAIQAGTHARLMRSLVTLPGEPCVIVLCHPVKNAQQDNLLPRGGGAFLAEVDGNLTCWRTDSLFSLHWQGKFRGPDFAPITFQLETATSNHLRDSKGRQIPSVIAKALSDSERHEEEANSRSDEDAVLIAIAEHERISMVELATSLRWMTNKGEPNKSKVQRVAERLKRLRLIESERSGLTLSPKGKEEAARVKTNAELAGSRYG